MADSLILEAVVSMVPVGKSRPRFSSKSGRTYTPAKTTQAEAQIAGAVKQIWGNQPPLTGIPLHVELVCYFPIPKSWPKKKQAAAKWHTAKPDKDNVEKLVLDAMHNIVYLDDSCVCSGGTQKLYSDTPRIEIRIRRLD